MAVERARELRKTMSKPEVMLWLKLRPLRAVGYHIRRQAPVGHYTADFICHAARLVIEVDGEQHFEDRQHAHDQVRDRWFATQGYETLRIPASDVLKDPDEAAEQVWLAHQRRLPHPVSRRKAPPDHPPQNGEG